MYNGENYSLSTSGFTLTMARFVKPSPLLLPLLLGSFLNGGAMAKDTAVDGSVSAEKNSTAKTASVDDNRQTEAIEGPVFKNAAPPATYPPYSKKDPWESVNRKIFSFNEADRKGL
jgi:phospholipid-binding lipoprotein MlaA